MLQWCPMTLRFRWFLALGLAVAGVAQATTMLALDVAGLSGSSDAVVRARVGQVSARWTRDRARIVTDVELTVLDAWKGTASGKIVVTQPGGEVGDIGQRVDGAAAFVAGEEVVLFLEARGGAFTVAGMAQGRFKVERASDGQAASVRQDQCGELHLVDPLTRQTVTQAPLTMSLDALRRQVVSAAGAPAAPSKPRVAP